MKLKKTALLLTAALICGVYTVMGQPYPGQLKWQAPFTTGGAAFGGVGGSAVATSDGSKIFITADDGFLYGINPTNGQALAGFTPPNLGNIRGYSGGGTELISSPLIARDGTIYVASTDQHLYSVSQTGAINFALPVGQGPSVCAVAEGPNGMLYLTGDDDRSVYAVDPSANGGQGEVVWSLNIPQAIGKRAYIDSAPTVGSDGTIYFYIADGNGATLVAVTDEGCRGAVKWNTDLGALAEEDNDFHTTLALDNAGRIYAPYGAQSTSLVAINVTNGQIVPLYWPFTTPSGAAIHSSPTIGTNGTIFFGADDGVFYALNPDGSLKWSFDTTTHVPISSTAAFGADASLYFGSEGGRLWSIEEFTNDGIHTNAYLKWIYPSLWSQPAWNGAIRSSPLMVGADNAIYFGCDDGNVYSIIGNAPPASSQWPMFRKDIFHSASTAPATMTLPVYTVAASVDGPPDIYKGYTGFGIPYGGLSWFTLTRSSCSGSVNTALQVTFLLGGDGTAFSTPYYNYNNAYAYSGLDFTPSGCNQAPFPNGFYVNFQPGEVQKTVYVQTLDNYTSDDVQALLLTIPPGQPGFSPEASASTATVNVHPNPNN